MSTVDRKRFNPPCFALATLALAAVFGSAETCVENSRGYNPARCTIYGPAVGRFQALEQDFKDASVTFLTPKPLTPNTPGLDTALGRTDVESPWHRFTVKIKNGKNVSDNSRGHIQIMTGNKFKDRKECMPLRGALVLKTGQEIQIGVIKISRAADVVKGSLQPEDKDREFIDVEFERPEFSAEDLSRHTAFLFLEEMDGHLQPKPETRKVFVLDP